MPKTISDSEGNDIEVFTSEELETQKNEASTKALEDFKKENPDKTEELEKLQEELKTSAEELETAKEDLEKAGDKDQNFKALREATKKKEEELKDLHKTMDEKIGTVKKEILDGVTKQHYTEVLASLAVDDDELKEKIALVYKEDLSSVVATTKEEVSKKLRSAWAIATDKDEEGALNTAVISSAGASKIKAGKKVEFSPDEKVLGDKLGISPDDIKKYGNK